MRALVLALIVGLSGCSALEGDACPGPNPGSCATWDDCVTDPDQPGFDQCGGTIYACQGGEWTVIGWCDLPLLDVTGPLTLHLTETSTTCTDLLAPDPVVLAQSEYDVERGVSQSYISANLVQPWLTSAGEPATPMVSYDVTADRTGALTGRATATLGDCRSQFDVTGTYQQQ